MFRCNHHDDGVCTKTCKSSFNPLNAELNPICHLLALLGVHHIFHVSGLRVNVNFNVNFKIVFKTIHLCISWRKKNLIRCKWC
jgi:hypothetical protein